MENCVVETREGSRQKAGERDLIIRMLAEVFRVRQSKEGPMRWEQVSSSLVPVSLYSRTTERWLNRLTSDLPIGQAACTMTPDSHRLLLMLHLSSSGQKFAKTQDDPQNRVVFQVVAHDFYEGRIWTLLNSKITQPGTKLGYGSDYFVYWKDTTNPPMQQSQPSFASNQTPCCQHLNQQLTSKSHRANGAGGVRQTWGLNFASVNDAKLFYDVCSMNPVNLSFNPAFLKKFSKTIGCTSYDGNTLIRQRMLRNHTDSDLKTILARQSNNNDNFTSIQSATCESLGRQHSSSRTSSPRKQCNTTHYGHMDFVRKDERRINSCIAQLRQSDTNRSNFRSRSCSTSHRKSCNQQQSLDKQMSQSTYRLSSNKGDVSDYGSINNSTTKHNHQQQPQFIGTHNPNCETLLREQELLREHYHFHNYMCPKKPARGQFRDSSQGSRHHKNSPGVSPLTPEVEQMMDHPNCGYISDQTGNKSSFQQGPVFDHNNLNLNDVDLLDNQASIKFIESKSNQRRSTAVDTSSINRFNASLARANYAKSKNLSLDAGGFQSTPTPTHPVNWNDSTSHKQTIVSEKLGEGREQRKEEGQEELVPINLVNSEVTCIKLHQKSSIVDSATQTQCQGSDQQVSMVQSQVDRQPLGSSIDYQLQMEALNVAVPYGFDTNRCEASTTTDDLPLDPIVRKRMFQLTVAKAEKEIADKYSAERESYLQSERLIKTMNELTSFRANKTGTRNVVPEVRHSVEKEGCIIEQPQIRSQLQLEHLPQPSFLAHRGDLSDSSFVSSPEAEAVPMRTKRRPSRPMSSNHDFQLTNLSEVRSKTMPNIKHHQNLGEEGHDNYVCCFDMISGKHRNCHQTTDAKTSQYKSVPTIVDQQSPIYHHGDDKDDDNDDDEDYNYNLVAEIDAHGGATSHQLCYMQKLSNTLSSVSDFEH